MHTYIHTNVCAFLIFLSPVTYCKLISTLVLRFSTLNHQCACTVRRTAYRTSFVLELTRNYLEFWSKDNSVGIVTSAVGWTRERERGGEEDFPCFQRFQAASVTHPFPYLTGNGGLSSGVKEART
jgi:hypothetical protein